MPRGFVFLRRSEMYTSSGEGRMANSAVFISRIQDMNVFVRESLKSSAENAAAIEQTFSTCVFRPVLPPQCVCTLRTYTTQPNLR